MNANEQKGYDIANGVMTAIGRLGLFLIVIWFIINLFGWGTDDTDYSSWRRSGLSLHTDAKTGLQYLAKDGALIPRLDQEGNHMRKEAP